MITSDEILSMMAEAYHNALYANIDMRKAVDVLETIRAAMSEEKEYFKIWDVIDEQIGKTCIGACDEKMTETAKKLQSVLVGLRMNFEQKIVTNIISDLHVSFEHDANLGWNNWIRIYAEALSLWRLKVCKTLSEKTFSPLTDRKREVEKFRSSTKLILHERWAEAYNFFIFLANLEILTNVIRAKLCVVAGEIQLYHLNNLEMAFELFTQAKDLAPDEARVVSGFGEYDLEKNQVEDAKKWFHEVLKRNPHLVDGYTNMGDCYERQNNLSAAEDWYKEAVRMVSGNSYGYVKLLRLYGRNDFSQTNKDKMFNLYEHIKTINPFDEYTTALDIANAYKEEKTYEKAYKWYKRAIDLDGTRLAAYTSIGNAYMDEGKYDLSYSSFERALEVAPEAVDPYLSMALLAEKQQQWEKAISWYQRGMVQGPMWRGFILAKMSRIRWQYQNKHEDAERELIDELQHNVSDKTILSALHQLVEECYRNLKDPQRSLGLLKKILVIIGPSYEAEYQYRVGNMRYYLGVYKDAIDSYQKAISFEPNNALYYASLGDAIKGTDQTEQFDEAEKAYRKAIELDPKNAEYLNKAGNLYFDTQDYSKAVNYYLDAVNLAPREAVYHANLGGAYRALGQWNNAEKTYKRAVELYRDSAEYQNSLGNVYFESGRSEESIEPYRKAIGLAPDMAVYHANLANSYRALGRYEEAVTSYLKALELDNQPVYECDLGRSYGYLDQWGKMIEHCQKAVELRKKTLSDSYGLDYYYEYLAEAYFKAGRLREFEDLFEASGDLRDMPEKKAVVYNRIGILFFSEDKDREAIPYYERAIRLNSRTPVYEVNVGQSYGNLGEWDKMIEHCERAVELRRNVPADSYEWDYYYGYLAEAYFKAGRLGEFEDLFGASWDLNDEPEKKAVVYNRIANFFFDEHKDEESIAYYAKATALAPRMAVYHANLGGAYRALGQWEKAEKAYLKAVGLEPGNADYQNRLGLIYYELKRFEASLPYYEKAIEINPNDAVFYSNLGTSYEALGQWEKAKEAYTKAVELDAQPIYNCDLGRAYGGLGEWDKMIMYCHESVELRRKSPSDPYGLDYYHEYLAEAYFRGGRLREFEVLFEGSGDLKDEPEKKAVIYNRIGNFFFRASQNQEAVPYYEKAITLDSHIPIYECNLGLTFGNLGEWEKAIEHYTRAVELRRKAPTDPYGLDYYYDYLAEGYYEAGRLKEFEGLFEASGDLRDEPEKKAVIYNRIGNLLGGESRNREAVPYYEKAITLDSHIPIYECNLGLTFGNLGQWGKAIEHYTRAVELRRKTPTDPVGGLDYYYEYLAEGYYEAGRLKEFEGLFEASGDLRDEPEKRAAIYNRIGNLYFGDLKNEESILYYKNAVGLAPRVAVYYANLGGAYKELGQWEEAEKAYLKAVELEPGNADYQNRLGLIYYELKRFEASLPYYKKAIEINPNDAVFRANLGTSYGALGQWEKAKEAYTKAVELDAQPIYYCDLGRAYGNLGEWEKAVEHYTRAVELRRGAPTDPYGLDYYYDYLAEAYTKGGRLKEFDEFFETSGDLRDEPEKKAAIYNRIGNFFFRAVQNREAIPYYKKAIMLDSHIPIYECNLGLTFGNLGQWEKAIEHYTRAVELRRKAPTDPYGLDYYYDYLAEGYFKDGRFKEAEKIYLRILELQPNNAEYQDKIGFVYSQLGDYNKAADHFQKAVVLRPDSQVYISDLIKISEKIANPVARKSLLESTLRYVPENIELKQALENLKQ